MDIMKPELQWINSTCYRVNPTRDLNLPKDRPANSQEYIEDDLYSEEYPEDYVIEMTENDRYKTSFHVPSVFHGSVIGVKGMTRKRVESETKTQIRIPDKQHSQNDIIITGPNRDSIRKSRHRIEMIVLAARNKQPYTHFISIPIMSPIIKQRFLEMKQKVVEGNYGIAENLFINEHKLHLTVAVLSLMDNEDRDQAAKMLKHCDETIVRPTLQRLKGVQDFKLKITGIECMNDDISAANVVYAKIESDIVQEISNKIMDYLTLKGYMKRMGDTVKMHMTLINTRYGMDLEASGGDAQKRQTIDASRVMNDFKSYEFGEESLNEIHLSRRHTTSETGFYEANAVIYAK